MCVLIVGCDVFGDGNTPRVCDGTTPAFKDGFFLYHNFGGLFVIKIEFISVADGDVARLGKFSAAEEGLGSEQGCHIHCP